VATTIVGGNPPVLLDHALADSDDRAVPRRSSAFLGSGQSFRLFGRRRHPAARSIPLFEVSVTRDAA